jgi:rhodanese-related sulfurtransferase
VREEQPGLLERDLAMVQEASGMEKLAGKVSEAGDEANKVQDEAQREAGKEAVQVEDRRLIVLCESGGRAGRG